jgi:aspartate/methionine/tyrosine aminotransferase
MKCRSLYLDWYTHVLNVKYDFRSSGITHFRYNLSLGNVDLSVAYDRGNPDAAERLAKLYRVEPESVFASSEGASGQNARIIRCVAERNLRKNEAVIEYPTYEPLLRQVQEHFKRVKRFERQEKDSYRLDPNAVREVVSQKTGLLVLTNPHAPSGAVSDANELKEVMAVARELGFYVLCDEIYAEFDRKTVPTLFSIDPERGIITTSFTKAYGLGGLKLGIALAPKELVDELYTDVLNTVGNSPNIVQLIAAKILTEGKENLERHKLRWNRLKNDAEKLLIEKNLKFFPNKVGVTFWVKLSIKDTYKWINECTIPLHDLVAVPGTFFLFRNDSQLRKSNMIRLGLGGISPEKPNLEEGFQILEKALDTSKKSDLAA